MIKSLLFLIVSIISCNAFTKDLELNSIEIDVPSGLSGEFNLGLPGREWSEIQFCGAKTLYLFSINAAIVHKYTITGNKLQFDFGRVMSDTSVNDFKMSPQCDGYGVLYTNGFIDFFDNGSNGAKKWTISDSHKCTAFTIATNLDVTCFVDEYSKVIKFFNGKPDGDFTPVLFGGSIGEVGNIEVALKGQTGEIDVSEGTERFLANNAGIAGSAKNAKAQFTVKNSEKVRFTWIADSDRAVDNEDYEHYLYRDLPDPDTVNSAFRAYSSGVSEENNKHFSTTIGPGDPGFYQMVTKCVDAGGLTSNTCDFDNKGVQWKIEYLLKESDSFGCNGKAFDIIGGFTGLYCPGYDFSEGNIDRFDAGAFVVFDPQNKYASHEHPASSETQRTGEKFALSNGFKIYATQRETENGSIKLKRYAFVGSTLKRSSGFVYDTGTNDIDKLLIVGDSNDNTDMVYVIVQNSGTSEIRSLSPLTNTQTALTQLIETTNVAGKVTAFGAKFSQGNFIAAVSGQNITGFVSESGNNAETIPFTKSGKVFAKYPKNLVPKTFTDFILFPAIVTLSAEEREDMSVFEVIKRRISNTAIKGYVATKNTVNGVEKERVVEYLQGRGASPQLVGPLEIRPNHDFYEVLPILTHFFDYEEDPSTCIPDKFYCLYEAATEAEARDLCFDISRCEGYVGTCMVEARSYSSCTESTNQFYNKKKYRHRVFELIDENPWPFIGAAGGIAILHFGFVLRFHWYL